MLHVLDGESFDDAMESMGDTQLQMWCDRSLNVVINKGRTITMTQISKMSKLIIHNVRNILGNDIFTKAIFIFTIHQCNAKC